MPGARIPQPRAAPLDLPGVLLSCADLFTLTYGLIEAGSQGWGALAFLPARSSTVQDGTVKQGPTRGSERDIVA